MARKVLVNELSWSKTRHERFKECRRAYYLYYYLSWGGWDLTAERWRRQLYILKKLSNRFTWAGSVVHAAIRGTLMAVHHGRQLEPARLIDRVHRVMRADFAFSRERKYWGDRIRKEFSGLVEHEYAEELDPAAWRSNWENVEQALGWFFQSEWVERARGLPRDRWLEVDVIDFEKSIFRLEGVKVFAVPDFAFVDHDGSTVIVDWKTGQPREGYEDQVLGYGLYLASRYGRPLDSMHAELVYLNAGSQQTVQLDPLAFDRFKDKFAQSTAQMKALLRDVERNVPQPETAFPMTEDLASCARCVFRRACRREQAVREAQVVPKPLQTEPSNEPSP